MKADHLDLPSQCPECGRECSSNPSFVAHYSQVHGPPYPWKDRTERGHEWPQQRREALDRDGEECQECGAGRWLEVHHINCDKKDHRLDNLVTLCWECHRKLHRILGLLAEGRVTPPYVADRLDVSREYASERLIRLKEHGHVDRLAPGLYELVDDPTGE